MSALYNSTCERILIELSRKPIGKVINYLPRIGVAIVTLSDEIHANDRVLIEGFTTSFAQDVSSIEISNGKVEIAKAGQTIGLKLNDKARKRDIVFKLPFSTKDMV
jgi:GTPase